MRTELSSLALIVVVFLVSLRKRVQHQCRRRCHGFGAASQIIGRRTSLLYSFLSGLSPHSSSSGSRIPATCRYLKSFSTCLVASVLTALVVHVPWVRRYADTVIPSLTSI